MVRARIGGGDETDDQETMDSGSGFSKNTDTESGAGGASDPDFEGGPLGTGGDIADGDLDGSGPADDPDGGTSGGAGGIDDPSFEGGPMGTGGDIADGDLDGSGPADEPTSGTSGGGGTTVSSGSTGTDTDAGGTLSGYERARRRAVEQSSRFTGGFTQADTQATQRNAVERLQQSQRDRGMAATVQFENRESGVPPSTTPGSDAIRAMDNPPGGDASPISESGTPDIEDPISQSEVNTAQEAKQYVTQQVLRQFSDYPGLSKGKHFTVRKTEGGFEAALTDEGQQFLALQQLDEKFSENLSADDIKLQDGEAVLSAEGRADIIENQMAEKLGVTTMDLDVTGSGNVTATSTAGAKALAEFQARQQGIDTPSIKEVAPGVVQATGQVEEALSGEARPDAALSQSVTVVTDEGKALLDEVDKMADVRAKSLERQQFDIQATSKVEKMQNAATAGAFNPVAGITSVTNGGDPGEPIGEAELKALQDLNNDDQIGTKEALAAQNIEQRFQFLDEQDYTVTEQDGDVSVSFDEAAKRAVALRTSAEFLNRDANITRGEDGFEVEIGDSATANETEQAIERKINTGEAFGGETKFSAFGQTLNVDQLAGDVTNALEGAVDVGVDVLDASNVANPLKGTARAPAGESIEEFALSAVESGGDTLASIPEESFEAVETVADPEAWEFGAALASDAFSGVTEGVKEVGELSPADVVDLGESAVDLGESAVDLGEGALETGARLNSVAQNNPKAAAPVVAGLIGAGGAAAASYSAVPAAVRRISSVSPTAGRVTAAAVDPSEYALRSASGGASSAIRGFNLPTPSLPEFTPEVSVVRAPDSGFIDVTPEARQQVLEGLSDSIPSQRDVQSSLADRIGATRQRAAVELTNLEFRRRAARDAIKDFDLQEAIESGGQSVSGTVKGAAFSAEAGLFNARQRISGAEFADILPDFPTSDDGDLVGPLRGRALGAYLDARLAADQGVSFPSFGSQDATPSELGRVEGITASALANTELAARRLQDFDPTDTFPSPFSGDGEGGDDLMGAVSGRAYGAAVSGEAALRRAANIEPNDFIPDAPDLSGVRDLTIRVEPSRPPRQFTPFDEPDTDGEFGDFENTVIFGDESGAGETDGVGSDTTESEATEDIDEQLDQALDNFDSDTEVTLERPGVTEPGQDTGPNADFRDQFDIETPTTAGDVTNAFEDAFSEFDIETPTTAGDVTNAFEDAFSEFESGGATPVSESATETNLEVGEMQGETGIGVSVGPGTETTPFEEPVFEETTLKISEPTIDETTLEVTQTTPGVGFPPETVPTPKPEFPEEEEGDLPKGQGDAVAFSTDKIDTGIATVEELEQSLENLDERLNLKFE